MRNERIVRKLRKRRPNDGGASSAAPGGSTGEEAVDSMAAALVSCWGLPDYHTECFPLTANRAAKAARARAL